MAAVTGVITALAGVGLSAYQAYESSQDKKAADAAAKSAKQALSRITEQNPYADVQAPDISSLAFDQIARSEAGAVEALKGLGVEGASQVVNVLQAGKEAQLKTAETQAGLEYQRNMAEAEAQKEINARKAARQQKIAKGDLAGAQLAAAAAEEQRKASIASAVKGVGDVATGIGKATSLEAKAQRNEKKASKVNTLDQNDAAAALEGNMTGLDSSIYGDIVSGFNQILNTY